MSTGLAFPVVGVALLYRRSGSGVFSALESLVRLFQQGICRPTTAESSVDRDERDTHRSLGLGELIAR
jgi:hypothetical protein